ncbi:MAG: hypothetical protein JSW71_12425 [Gemmatimonadota bacterium]|nr:MAG: hypothetical protein JSW71_12425 [Gemmatimonadota bacterium]
MRAIGILIPLGFVAVPALAQAPASAALWRVAAASLAVPPALQVGPLALAWNPAARPATSGVYGGLEMVHTSNVVGISGFSGDLTIDVGQQARLGLALGRLDVRDLVRTSTSPGTVAGSIPVYIQYAGVGGQLGWHTVVAGALLRVNNERFDVIRETGLTFDLGISWSATPRLKLAAATHFLPVDFSKQETTDYYAGVEYELIRSAEVGGIPTSVTARYGVTYRSYDALEHGVSAGVLLGGYVGLDAALTREVAYGMHQWRPALGLFLKVGRYEVDIARSSGLNDLGATYRVGLSVAFVR